MSDDAWTSKMMIILSLVVIIGLGGCAPPTLEPLPTPTPYDLTNLPEGAVALTWETIKLSEWGGYTGDGPTLRVVASPEDVADIEGLIEPDALAIVQDVDFDREFALIVLQGLKKSTGYKVEIRAVVRQETEIAIHAYFVAPRPGQPVGASETSPYHAIRVRKEGKWDGEFSFILYDNDRRLTQVEHFVP